MTGDNALAPNMIGRRDQLGALRRYLDLARAGAGQLVFLAGEAGVGKTRLIREFTARARASGRVAILEGRCYDEDPAVPYGPFVDAIRAAMREYGPEAIARACDPWTADLLRLLPELASVAPEPRAADDPQFQKRRLFEAIFSLIRPHDAQVCHVVVLEDAHWADPTSQELIQYLARVIERERLLLIVSYRTDELHRRHPLAHLLAQLNRERLFQEIRLAPLVLEELAGLLEAALGRTLPAVLVETLFDRTGGNPFFAEELLKSLIAHGQLDTLIAAAQAGRVTSRLATPLSIKDTILERAADLDATTAEVLTYAAVIGRRSDFDLLLRLTGLSEAELLRCVERLVERQLVVEEPGGDDYSFRHALTREAVYDDLLGRERRMRHREVLAALEAMHADRPDDAIDQLAYHSVQGRQLEQAARYTRMAGERAACMYAYREAVSHYEVALDVLDAEAPAERAELLASLGHAAYPLGDFSRCARAWREAQRLYEQLGDWRRSAELLRWLGRVAWERDDPEVAFAHTRAAIAILEAEPPGRDLAMAYSALSQLYMVSSHPDESIEWGEKALALADQFGDVAVTTHALNNVGVALAERGEGARGIAYLERSLELAKQHDHLLDELRAYLNLSGNLLTLGQLGRSAALLREGIARAEQVHVELYSAKMRDMLGRAELLLGNWDAARALLDRPQRQGTPPQPEDEERYPLLGELLLRQGRPDQARRLLESQLARPERREDTYARRPLYASLVRVYLALGELGQALALLEQRFGRRETGFLPKGQELLSVGVEVYVRAGMPDKAAELVEALAALDAAGASPILVARLAEGRGLLAAHAGQHAEAAASFARAHAQWQALALPYEAARARRRRAASLLQHGDTAAREAALAELAAARAVFERLGALLELEAVDKLIPRPAPRRAGLTRREREVIALIAQGYSNREIGEALTIAEKTAEVHVGNILGKLGLASRAHAAAYAVEHGLADPQADPQPR
jgi:ATP/maltotriose-dependent transcriptional regulator MalT